MHVAVAVAGVAICLLASACDTADDSPAPTTPATPTTSTQVAPCPGPTIESDPSSITRWEAGRGSTWWVTYAVLKNDCKERIRFQSFSARTLDQTGASLSGRALLAPDRGPVDALVPGSPVPAGTALTGATLEPGQTARLALQVDLSGSGEPQAVPKIDLRMLVDDPAQEVLATIGPDISFCACPQPTSD